MRDQPNPAAPQMLRALERQTLALALRKQGASYAKIAGQLRTREDVSDRYSVATAYTDVMTALKRLNEKNGELAAEVRRLEVERLNDLHAVYWPKAIKGDFASFDRVLALMAARARYLGLYPSEHDKIDITVYVRDLAEKMGLDPDDAVKEAQRIVTGTR